ncbi:hypothetical protein [Micromonospora sp. NPDC005367]
MACAKSTYAASRRSSQRTLWLRRQRARSAQRGGEDRAEGADQDAEERR